MQNCCQVQKQNVGHTLIMAAYSIYNSYKGKGGRRDTLPSCYDNHLGMLISQFLKVCVILLSTDHLSLCLPINLHHLCLSI